MTYRLTVEPEAEAEIDAASQWYGDLDEELGTDFLQAVDTALAAIQENPLQYQIVHGKKRRVLLTRFPYRLVYWVSGDEVIVVACIHGRRDPKSWQERSE